MKERGLDLHGPDGSELCSTKVPILNYYSMKSKTQRVDPSMEINHLLKFPYSQKRAFN
jgi:hypothetical protein